MGRAAFAAFVLALLAAPVAAEEWKNVSVIDTMCLDKVKANPDAHTRDCLLQCSKSGYGLLTPDGKYLKFDAAGNELALAAIKAAKKNDHLRASITGELTGETIKVSALTFN